MSEEAPSPQRPSPAPPAGRAPPHSVEAEEYLLGCCLIDGADTIARCLEAKLPGASVLFARRTGSSTRRSASSTPKSPPVDVAVLAEELKTARQLDAVGGYAFLAQLSEPHPDHRAGAVLHREGPGAAPAARADQGLHADGGEVPQLPGRARGVHRRGRTGRSSGSRRTGSADVGQADEGADPRGDERHRRR